MSFETGWCDDCGCPIGLGPCADCCAYSTVVVQSDDPPVWPEDEWEDEGECPDTIEGLSSLAGVQPTEEHLREWRKLREENP